MGRGGMLGGWGGFGLGCVGSRAGVCWGVGFRVMGSKSLHNPTPPGNASPTQTKTYIKLGHHVVRGGLGLFTVYYAFFFKVDI